MRLYNILAIVFLSMLISCKSVEMFKEHTEIAPKEKYNSFVIINNEVGIRAFSDQLLDEKVNYQLQQKMEQLGMVYDNKSPELVIRFGSSEDPRQKEFYPNQMSPMWGWRVWDPWMFNPMHMNRQSQVTSKNYELIQLIVDFIDPKKDKMIMRLTAVSEAHGKKDKQKKLRKSVEEVIKTYIDHLNQTDKR